MPEVPLSLDVDARADLERYLATGLRVAPCDHTLERVRAWAAERGIRGRDELERELALAGGLCDCEVFNNVLHDPEDGPATSRIARQQS